MYCDFPTVTDILYNHIGTSSINNYNSFLEMLFSAYLNKTSEYKFERYESSKLHSGAQKVPPQLSEFYMKAERSLMTTDISSLLKFLFDKENLHRTLYHLIMNDELLSAEYRKSVINRVQPDFTDDTALADIIYEAVYTALTRPYHKSDGGYIAKSYFDPLAPLDNSLFANGKPVTPCRHFCGRDAELEELHTLLQEESKVIVTGVAGIGKSELVRAYAQKYKSQYAHIGYYFYNSSLKSMIADVNRSPLTLDTDIESRYQSNLELLSSLGRSTLLVIDNFNAAAEDDECFEDLLDLECTLIFTSHMHYDDLCVYELKEMRKADNFFELIRKFYPFDDKEKNNIVTIITSVNMHTFSVELCARLLKKGLYTPKSLRNKLYGGGFYYIFERLSAKKDKHSKKGSCYEHISDLFKLMELSEPHQDILRMMIVAPDSGIRKDFIAGFMNLRNMQLIEDLIESGLIYEFENGEITLLPVIKSVVKPELEPDNENCSPLIDSLNAISTNESIEVDGEKLCDIAYSIVSKIYFKSCDDRFYSLHNCYKCMERFKIDFHTSFVLHLEKYHHQHNDGKQRSIYESDAASYHILKGETELALDFQKSAVESSKSCDDVILQANTVSTYGYYLNLADRKEEALKAMELGLTLFSQTEGDGVFYFDKYRAVINYCDLLFSVGNTAEAVKYISAAVDSLEKLGLNDAEIYAECLYSLGLFHLCMNDTENSEKELVRAFQIYLKIHDRDSEFIQYRLSELKRYMETAGTEFTAIQQLLS